ncbi:hypothetical protein AAD018_003885 [Aestuariibius insulae]|uniref:hypothetical protein n=1 Tax=Aestuariibius insulae TaxID=2058287 RepID=UPI00345E5888
MDLTRKAIIAWCALVIVGIVTGLTATLAFATEPDYFLTAIIQASMVACGLIWIYATLAVASYRRSDNAPKWNRSLFWFWSGIAGLMLLASVFPDPNKDEFATQRFAASILLLSLFAVIHWGFHRGLRNEGATCR